MQYQKRAFHAQNFHEKEISVLRKKFLGYVFV